VKPEVRVISDAATMYRIAVSEFAQVAKEDVWGKDCFTVNLSGGSTPRAFYSVLATTPEFCGQIPWRKCFFFWGDERQVPPGPSESNFGMVKEALLRAVPVRPWQIFRVSGELDQN
jgi:6-phosphogluconolactonase